MDIEKTIKTSFSERKTIKIKYYSQTSDRRTKEREIDVYGYNRTYFGGYCHLRQDVRNFRFDRVLKAEITDKSYEIDISLMKKLENDGYINSRETSVSSQSPSKKKNRKRPGIVSSPVISELPIETDNDLTRIINYYISCILEENNKSRKLRLGKADEKYLINFLECETLISLNRDSLTLFNTSDKGKNFFTPSLIDGKEGATYYGYPLVVNPIGDISPLFKIEVKVLKSEGEYKLIRQSENVFLNQLFLQEDLDLGDEEIKVVTEEIDSFFLKNQDFQERINYILDLLGFEKTFINPEYLSPLDSLPETTFAIVNQAIIFTSASNSITGGLLNELALLKQENILNKSNETCLDLIMQSQRLNAESEDHEILYVLPSNKSQDSVLKNVFQNELTVVTGPPGTGKSQVVVNLLVNVISRGETALFASKNNKAVDVVFERLGECIGSRNFIRTGSWEHRKSANEFLKTVKLRETGRYRSNIKKTFEQTKKSFHSKEKEYLELFSKHKKVEELQSILEGSLPVNISESLRPVLGNRGVVQQLLGLLGDKIRLLQNDLNFTERMLVFVNSKYLPRKILKLQELIDKLLPNEISEWIFDDESFVLEERFDYFKLHISTYYDFLNQKKDLDVSNSLDLVKTSRDDSFEEYLRMTKELIRSQLDSIKSNFTFCQENMIHKYADATEKINWTSMFRKNKEELARVIERNYKTVLQAFPVWITTSLSAEKAIPLIPGMFDYLIVDEASQCDIASVLPLMYRAKKMVVIGDPHQLKHICTLNRAIDQYLANRYNATVFWQNMSYREKSLYDFAENTAKYKNIPIFWLLEHYRCERNIIGFSNDRFYENKLVFYEKEYPKIKEIPPGISWVDTQFEEGSDKTNISEVNYIEKHLKRLKESGSLENISVGIVTPFRRQANVLNERLKDYQVVVGTAHRYQGDEKDLIFFSTVINENTKDKSVKWINLTENLVNVAVTRARRSLVVVGSVAQCMRMNGILKDLARYIQMERESRGYFKNEEKLESPAERALYFALIARGCNPVPQYPSIGYFIDLALIGGLKKIAIEVDGEPFHSSPLQRKRDEERDLNLEKHGWQTMRFSGREIYLNLDEVADKITHQYYG